MLKSTNTTLLKKLLKFFLPLLIIPIVVVVVFYHNYIDSLITQEIVNKSETTIIRISNSPSIQKHLKTSKDISLPNIDILDINAYVVFTNKIYDKNINRIKQYIKLTLETNENKIYHNKQYQFMIKPIIEKNKIKSFIVIDYQKNIAKKLANTNQTFIFILLIVIFLIFISVIFTLIFALQVTNPIKELIEGINIISKGDKNHKIEITSDDEISILVNAFNKMIDNVNQNQKDIENLNSNLIQKVENEVDKNRKKDQQIIQQSRLAQMGEMISMIAHQWRQPLAAISSTSSGINLKAKLNKLDKDTAIKLSNKISEYSQHLSGTIDDFREFFKSNKEKRNTTYNELIQSVLNIIEVSIKNKNINLITNLNCKDTLITYPNEIKQVILNLIKNAEDIVLEKEIENPTIIIDTSDCILTISDNGGGIPTDIMNKIFDPYFSTKLEKNGTGLGLYMSKTIIEEHCGGSLTVSNNDDGAIFKIILGENNV